MQKAEEMLSGVVVGDETCGGNAGSSVKLLNPHWWVVKVLHARNTQGAWKLNAMLPMLQVDGTRFFCLPVKLIKVDTTTYRLVVDVVVVQPGTFEELGTGFTNPDTDAGRFQGVHGVVHGCLSRGGIVAGDWQQRKQ